MREDGGALRGRELLEDVGDVGGMELVEALVGHGQLDLRQVAVEQVHVVPRDERLRQLRAHERGEPAHEALKGRRDAAQDAAGTHFGAEQAQLVARLGQLQVVDAHDLHALRVDDLLVQEVSVEQDLVGLQVAESDLGRRDVEADFLLAERVDVLAPRQHERCLVGAEERERRHAREDLPGGDRDIAYGSDLGAGLVDDRLAEHLREVEHGAPPKVGRWRA